MRSIQQLFEEGERILADLRSADGEVGTALEHDAQARRQLKEAERHLEVAEAEILTTAAIRSKAKEGPLAGIALTSDAYKAAVTKLLAEAHRGPLKELFGRVKEWQIEADDAKIKLEQAAKRFSAICHASNLLASMLQATSSLHEGNAK